MTATTPQPHKNVAREQIALTFALDQFWNAQSSVGKGAPTNLETCFRSTKRNKAANHEKTDNIWPGAYEGKRGLHALIQQMHKEYS